MSEIYSFDKRSSYYVKGFAILCMITYHVWGIKEYEAFFGDNSMFEVLVGQFGHICVPIYIFLSGYAMCLLSQKRKINFKFILERILKLLLKFWLIFLIFIPLGFYLNVYELRLHELIMNFFTFRITYNGDWWFIRLYIQLLLLLPIIKYFIERLNTLKTLVFSLFLYFLSFLMYLIPNINLFKGIDSLVYQDIRVILFNQLIFILGYIFAQKNIFIKIESNIIRYSPQKITVCKIIILIIIFLIRSFLYLFFENVIRFGSPDWFDFLYTPLIIYIVYSLIARFKIRYIFEILGKYSDNMWLVHTFFYKLYFHSQVYSLGNSLLILVIVLILSFITAYLIEYIFRNLTLYFDKLLLFIRKIKTT